MKHWSTPQAASANHSQMRLSSSIPVQGRCVDRSVKRGLGNSLKLLLLPTIQELGLLLLIFFCHFYSFLFNTGIIIISTLFTQMISVPRMVRSVHCMQYRTFRMRLVWPAKNTDIRPVAPCAFPSPFILSTVTSPLYSFQR